MGNVLTAVYPDYFPQTPQSISKGSSEVKGIFKGQYQVYPPIKTLTLSEFEISNLLTYVIIQVFYEGSQWYYVVTNYNYVPAFRIYLYNSYTSYSTYSSITYTAEGYVDISAGSRTTGYKYAFTPTITSGTASTLLQSNYKYGIGKNGGGSGSYGSVYYDVSSYRVCAYQKSPSGHLSGNTVYMFRLSDGINYTTKIYCKPESFTLTYQTAANSYTSINVPKYSNSDTSGFGYIYNTYFYLYDTRLPRVPNKIKINDSSPKLKIYNISSSTALSTTNTWHYLSAYFNNRTFGTLTSHYQHLTGDSSNINLFDYGVIRNNLTTYRYEIPAGSSKTLYQIKKGSAYEWDLDNCTKTFYLTPFGQNVSAGFYILGFFLSVPGSNFYFHRWQQQGGNYNDEATVNCNALSDGSSNGTAGTTTWNLNEPNKFYIDGNYTSFQSYGTGINITWGKPNSGFTYNLGTSQLTIILKGLYPYASIFTSGHKIKAGWGIDWLTTWAWFNTETISSVYVKDYFQTAPASLSDHKDFTVYCLCWSGYYGTASNQVSIVRLGTFRVNAKESTGTGTIEMQ